MCNFKGIKLAALLIFCSLTCSAQTTDSVSSSPPDASYALRVKPFERRADRVTSSRAYQIAYIGVPLIAAGLIIKSEDDHFRSLRNDYLPTFNQRYDDYLQYLPAAAMLGMKIGGVKGRSSWGRMVVSDAFSAIIMASVVNSVKATSNVMRPDGSNNHSFPSGHTATAFMTATMMSKEYGGVSPWYSIGAYSAATATGLTRMANNKHWLSDVLVGAGIGIISTELGYYLADLIFKERGITHFYLTDTFDRTRHPSFFGIYLGYNILPGTYSMESGSTLDLSTGSNAGLEGAWFLSPYIGIGGRFSIANMGVTLDNVAQEESLDLISGYAGAYFSYPMTARWLLGSKALVGYNYFASCDLDTTTIGGRGRIGVGTGVSFTFLAKDNLGVKFFVDYNLLPSATRPSRESMHMLTLGSSVSVVF